MLVCHIYTYFILYVYTLPVHMYSIRLVFIVLSGFTRFVSASHRRIHILSQSLFFSPISPPSFPPDKSGPSSCIMLEKNVPQTETPWGLTWTALLSDLKPAPSEHSQLTALAAQVDDLLKAASLTHESLFIGGAVGKKTLVKGEDTLQLYAIHHPFHPADYFDAHLKPMLNALTQAKSRFGNVHESGLAVCFMLENVSVTLFAAGRLYAGPKELLVPRLKASASNGLSPDVTALHVETTCAVLRVQFLAAQSSLFHDMVRVAKHWRNACKFMSSADRPGDYLLELLMLEAVQGAPVGPSDSDVYTIILRRFLALASTQCGTASDVMADESMPRSFLSWTYFYNRGAIDMCVAKGLLDVGPSDLCSLVVVDPAAPFVNVARTVADWGDLRRFARDSLAHFQNSELLDSLQTRLQALSAGMEETLGAFQRKIEILERLEASPRRWSGTIQFKEMHMNSDTWNTVFEIELRTVMWRVNARKARTESSGYSSVVDVSLQMMTKLVSRSIDVDVNFRAGTTNLVFDPKCDHVLIAKRSEVIRNREYPMQITIVA